MPCSIVIHHYLVSMDLNKQSGVVNCKNLEGISCLPGIIIHYNLFKNFLMGGAMPDRGGSTEVEGGGVVHEEGMQGGRGIG